MYGSVSTTQHIRTAHLAEACSSCTPATARSRGAVATATTWIGSWATTGRASGSPSSWAVPENDTPSSWAARESATPSSWEARENATRSSSAVPESDPSPMTSWRPRPNAVCSIRRRRSSRSPAPPPAPSGSDVSLTRAHLEPERIHDRATSHLPSLQLHISLSFQDERAVRLARKKINVAARLRCENCSIWSQKPSYRGFISACTWQVQTSWLRMCLFRLQRFGLAV